MRAVTAIASAAFVTCLLAQTASAQTDVLTNGSFESGLTGWTTGSHYELGATGTCSFNGAIAPGTETLTSLAGFPATHGTQIALGSVSSTTAGTPITSCVLYQDVAIPAGATTATITFDVGVKGAINALNNGYKVGIYSTAEVPGYTFAALNGSVVFASLAAADTTMQSKATLTFNISSRAGQTVRFAIINAVQNNAGEVIGVDNVHLLVTVPAPPVPALSTWATIGLVLLLGLTTVLSLRRRYART